MKPHQLLFCYIFCIGFALANSIAHHKREVLNEKQSLQSRASHSKKKPKTNPWTYMDVVNWGLGLDGTKENGRKSERADNSISKMLDTWKIPMSLIQLDTGDFRNPTIYYAPSVAQYNSNQPITDGADFFLTSYDKSLFAVQDAYNEQCYKEGKNCQSQAIAMVVWGTKGSMQLAKDGVMVFFSGLFKVGPGCNDFPDCPAGSVSLLTDNTGKYLTANEKDTLVQMGTLNSVDDIDKVMQSYATKTHQQLTLPNGSVTN